MARPTKYTIELQEQLCGKLRKGLPITTSCDLVHLHHDTYYCWIEKYPAFSEAVKEARAEAQSWFLSKLVEGIGDKTINWIAAAWFLERSNRKEWGRHDKVEQTHQVVQPADLLKELESHEGDNK